MNQITLRFRPDGLFRILQLTDMHLADVAGRDAVLLSCVPELIRREKPDLIALTGDIACDGTAEHMIEQFTALYSVMAPFGIPITMTLGNHESDGFDVASGRQYPLAEALEALPLCLFERGPADMGVGNYALPVYPHDGGDKPAWMLYHLDCHASRPYRTGESGTVTSDAYIWPAQIDWLKQSHAALQEAYGAVPSILFDHVPLPEFNDVWMFEGLSGDHGEKVCCAPVNSGLFAELCRLGDFRAVFAGHDHTNSFTGKVFGMMLAYGRCSGNLGWCLWPHPHALQSEARRHPKDGSPRLPDFFARGGRIIDLNETTGQIEQTYIARYDGKPEVETATPPRFQRFGFSIWPPQAKEFERTISQ